MSSLLPGPVVTPSGTRDNFKKSGTVPEIPGQLEPMTLKQPTTVKTKSIMQHGGTGSQASIVCGKEA